jgi:hypothetical protein
LETSIYALTPDGKEDTSFISRQLNKPKPVRQGKYMKQILKGKGLHEDDDKLDKTRSRNF